MKSRCRKWQARGNIIIHNAVFRLQLISFQIIEPSEHSPEYDVEFAISKAVHVSSFSRRICGYGPVSLHADTHSAAFAKWHVGFL